MAPTDRRISRRRAALSFDQAQLGDVRARDAAGGDIVHAGADPDGVLSFFREYVFSADQRRETAIKDVSHELGMVRGDMGVITDALRALRDRANDEDRERESRRGELDATLGELTEALTALADDQAIVRRDQRRLFLAILGLAALWLVGLAVLALLIYDRYAALALLRYWLGAGAALALALRR